MARLTLGACALQFAVALAGQSPVLHATEVGGYQAALRWQQEVEACQVRPDARCPGFTVRYFGYDRESAERADCDHEFDRQWASIAVLWPRADAMAGARAIMANSHGHIFVGRARDGGWRPELTTVVASGVALRLANMLLQSGQAQDGTVWHRIDGDPSLTPRRQRIRVEREDGQFVIGFVVEIGHSRFRWHPGWLPVDDAAVVAMRSAIEGRGTSSGIAEGRGLRARGQHIMLRGPGCYVALQPGDVEITADEIVITVRRDARASRQQFDDQAWVAEGLWRLAKYELITRDLASIDRDGDGRGEFGSPDAVMPASQRPYRRLENGLYAFRGHLFRVYVAADADSAERGFVAYAWPASSDGAQERAFFVDERGVVHACRSGGRFIGCDGVLPATARDDATLGWRPLR